MPTDRKKVIDDYIGMGDALKVYTLARDGLMKVCKFPEEKANRYAYFCQAIYKELYDNHEVVEALKQIANANKLLPQAVAMNLTSATGALKDYRLSGGVGVAAPVIARLTALAEWYGIPLNECSLSIAKVAMDCAGAGAGAVTFEFGIGVPLLVLSVLSTFNDSYGLGKACFQ